MVTIVRAEGKTRQCNSRLSPLEGLFACVRVVFENYPFVFLVTVGGPYACVVRLSPLGTRTVWLGNRGEGAIYLCSPGCACNLVRQELEEGRQGVLYRENMGYCMNSGGSPCLGGISDCITWKSEKTVQSCGSGMSSGVPTHADGILAIYCRSFLLVNLSMMLHVHMYSRRPLQQESTTR